MKSQSYIQKIDKTRYFFRKNILHSRCICINTCIHKTVVYLHLYLVAQTLKYMQHEYIELCYVNQE